MFLSALLLLQQVVAPATQRRDVPDPGVIASGQRITPAGVPLVFSGRVTGVRFGEDSRELWVTVPRSAFHVSWPDARVLARGTFNGRSGVQGVTIDRVRHRALVGALDRAVRSEAAQRPGAPTVSTQSIARLLAFDAGSRGDSIAPARGTDRIGEYIVGSPAVARTTSADGHRVAIVPLPADDRAAVVDADDLTSLGEIALGVAPIAAVLSADGRDAWISVLGGDRPSATDRSARQCCAARAERVRVDARGIAEAGTVVHVDVAQRRVINSITVGHHPTSLAWDEAHGMLYVADGNADAVSVIDTKSGTVAATIEVAPFRARQAGLAPTAVAVTPNGGTLFVALGGVNAVAVYDVADPRHARLRGLIPTAWYPSSLDVSDDGRLLAVGALFGVGAGEGKATRSPRGRYVFAERGTANVVEIPNDAQLGAWTLAVSQNIGLALAPILAAGDRPDIGARSGLPPRAVPERPGEPSLIDHVVLIVRENRTYDQVLGDLGRGDGDSALTMFGRDVTPNAHALAEQFVVLDRIFANGGNSADGHQWLTQANESEYATWPLYVGRSYPSESDDPLAYSIGGFLWESALAAHRTVSVFGEYAPAPSDSIPTTRHTLLADWRSGGGSVQGHFRAELAKRYNTHSPIPSLDSVLVREYPGWTLEVPDVVKADVIIDHLREWERSGQMPNLVMIVLPSDHTVGFTPGWCTPKACVADNDLALGTVVDGLSHSSFWPSMAIVAIEDDAQDGVDHVDGHRTVALLASPFAKRGAVDHTFYNQASVMKTIELMLGLPALSLFDLVAGDMRASFIAPGEAPDLTPFTMVQPRQSLFDENVRVGAITGPGAAAKRRAALASSRMRLDIPDAAPAGALNRILWHDARGWATAYPGARHALFFPMSRDVDDEDREVKRTKRQGTRPAR